MTLGASIARDGVDAVALRAGDGSLTDRMLGYRSVALDSSAAADVPRRIERLLDELAAQVGEDHQIAGSAVTYRDAAGRRAVVTGLASGRWQEASLVSAKSAHLALARAIGRTGEFGDVLVCELLPGYQGYSLISPHRDRVEAATAATAGFVSPDSIRPGLAAATEQLAAAGVSPDALMVIGSAAGTRGVSAALSDEFGAPVIDCPVAAVGSAIGAALVVQPEPALMSPSTAVRVSRGSVAVVAAASVLTGGLAVGGAYELRQHGRSDTTTQLADARAASEANRAAAESASRAASRQLSGKPRHARPDPG
ncbi:MAG: hypothetical protein J2P18_08250, partial [Nocardia sp.]|nr:hypothetical protein [Nocardia sp.]